MEKSIREFSGRAFSSDDIDQIIWLRKTFPKLSESELAKTVCETLGWLSLSGAEKRVTCVNFLRQLAAEGVIDLPAKKSRKTVSKKRKLDLSPCVEALPDETLEVTKIGGVELELVHAGERLKLLRAYLKKYHAIGEQQPIGEQLSYFIKDSGDGSDIGCMRFSPASWALEDREAWIGWTAGQKKERLFLVVNQSRYLIFPWVHVKNLSSRALSIAAKRLPGDWLKRYCYEPVLLETFVDTDFFKGTSYRAANWECIGQTKGRGRNDRHKEYLLSVKDIYVYPLRKDFRKILTGTKPYKAVDPDAY